MGKKKGKSRNYGHLKGVETVKKIVKSSVKLKIPIVLSMFFHPKIEAKGSNFYLS